MKSSWMGLSVVLCSLFTIGCQSGQKAENADLRKQNQELQAQLSEREARLRSAEDPSRYQALHAEIAQREAKIKELQAQLRKPEPATAAEPSIAGIETSYDKKKGELTVNLPSDVLFASGSADLKQSSRVTLDKIVAALRAEFAGKRIRVEGYTDSDPIVHTKKLWKDNQQLSEARASAVSKYLSDKGINKGLIGQAGLGDASPKATKAASRRVEIIVYVG